MKNTRPFWKSLALSVVALAMAFAMPVMAVAGAARSIYVAVKLWTVNAVSGALQMSSRREPDRTPQVVTLVRAKSFLHTMAQRSRPRMTEGWRMCPSI